MWREAAIQWLSGGQLGRALHALYLRLAYGASAQAEGCAVCRLMEESFLLRSVKGMAAVANPYYRTGRKRQKRFDLTARIGIVHRPMVSRSA
jgi:hypothetical protein